MPTGNDAVRKVVNGRAQKNKVEVDTSNGDQIRHSELENEPPKGTVQDRAPLEPGMAHKRLGGTSREGFVR